MQAPSGEESDAEDEGIVVGIRMTSGTAPETNSPDQPRERLMYWTQYDKDQCTYEENDECLQNESLVGSKIEIRMSDGTRKVALVKHQVGDSGSAYKMELPDGSGEHDFEMDLEEWVDPDVVGWNLCGYVVFSV